MSTRCNINIETPAGTICLYHHFDGYHDGVGFDLAQRIEKLSEKPWSCVDDLLNDLLKCAEEGYENKTGYEFSTCGLHGDIEYLYTVNFDKRSVICQKIYGWDKNKTFGKPIDIIKKYKYVNGKNSTTL